MNQNKTPQEEIPITREDEIFKLLTHQTRRNIIKALGERDLTFSQIQKKLEIDSPTLSYHLKSMKEFVFQEKSKYTFSNIGRAALVLLTKTDQSVKVSRFRRNLWYIYIVSLVCWASMGVSIPLTIIANSSTFMQIWILIILDNVIAIANISVIGFLRSRYIVSI